MDLLGTKAASSAIRRFSLNLSLSLPTSESFLYSLNDDVPTPRDHVQFSLVL